MTSGTALQPQVKKPRPNACAVVAAIGAVGVSMLLAYNVAPSATFFNQAAAIIGWGGFVLCVASGGVELSKATPVGPPGDPRAWLRSGSAAVWAALGLQIVACSASPFATGLPPALAGSAIGVLLAAGVVFQAGAYLAPREEATKAFAAVCMALAATAAISAVLGLIQVDLSQWTGNSWIAAVVDGRAAGNLRQANHLGTLLLWSLVAVVWLAEAGYAGGRAMLLLSALFLYGLVLTASRTATIGIVTLALWGLLDRQLSRPKRRWLMLSPLLYGLAWWATSTWAAFGDQPFAGAERFSTEGDISSSRFGIWSNTLTLISRYPWFGVGWGEFNFAWSLTPFPNRPVLFFDHTHNLLLQLVVETGVPLGLLVFALLAYALWQAMRRSWDAGGAHGAMRRAAFMMVLLAGIHSLLEYPLWYAYFLFPTLFAWGLCLGADRPAPARMDGPDAALPPSGRRLRAGLAVGAGLMGLGGLFALADYHRVALIFADDDDAVPLAQRIAVGQKSRLFDHHAHYAAATTAEPPSAALDSFGVAKHYLLDTRLMMAWANALHERGDDERARHIAARLREFRNDDSREFFAPCDRAGAGARAVKGAAALPFQCTPPSRAMDFRDFR